MSNAFVCIMGIGTVFFGLVCLVFITAIVSLICKVIEKPQTNKKTDALSVVEPIENKQEIVAAICAAIAEDLGTDASNIRVTSFKKL